MLGSLRDAFTQIAKNETYSDARLNAYFGEVAREFDDACSALAKPTLDLATVGTTSAGKSTFINALLGMELAPTDADEMSAGLLQIESSDRWSLIAEPAQAGAEAARDHDAIRTFMYERMREHIASRGEGDEEAKPTSYIVSGPLFPLHPDHDFRQKVDENIALRFFDLPGLRTIDDPENISIIKSKIRRAFSIVVMDLQSFFLKEQRERLLEELRETVRELGDDPSTILFIANKADAFSTTDRDNLSVAARCAEVEREIRACLGVREDVEIALLDFSALSYLRAAQMFTELEVRGGDDTVQSLRRKLVGDFKREYMRASLGKDGFRELRDLVRRIEDDLEDNVESERDTLVRASLLLMEGAGHSQFWDTLLERLATEGVRLIVFPVANVPLVEASKALEQARQHTKIMQYQSDAQFKALQSSIESARALARTSFQNGTQQLKDDLGQVVQVLRQNKTEGMKALYARVGFGSKLQNLLNDLVTELLTDISVKFLVPMIPFLQKKVPIGDVARAFEGIPKMKSSHAAAIASAYEALKDSGYMKYSQNGETLKYPAGSRGEKYDEVRRIRKALARFNLAMREAISAYSESYLNREVDLVADLLSDWLANRATYIWAEAKREIESNPRFDASSMSLPDTLQCSTPKLRDVKVPSSVIKIPEGLKSDTEKNRVAVGEAYEDPNASCFKGAKRTVYGSETITVFHIPDGATIVDTIEGGVGKASEAFWSRFLAWFELHIQHQGDELGREFEDFLDTLRRTVDTMIAELEREAEQDLDYWSDAERRADELMGEVNRAKVASGFAVKAVNA
jgi:GTPase SAR1 family protein